MSKPPFARRYWSLLTGAGASGSSLAAGRGRTGYTFWQRYWAAFIVADLPIQCAGTGQAGSGPGARRPVIVLDTQQGAAPFALPPAQPTADLAAADDSTGTAILQVRLPDGQTELALHRQGPEEYTLEITHPGAGAGDVPDVLRLRYSLSGGGEQVLLIPISAGIGLARLPGYAAGRPWTAEPPAPASEVSGWEPAITAIS